MPELRYSPDDAPAAAVAAHLELSAQTAGWCSATDQAIACVELANSAWRVIEWCHAIGELLPTWAHLLERMEDRFAAGVLRISVTPWKDGALGDECRTAARLVFRQWQEQVRREAMGDSTAWNEDDNDAHPFGPRGLAA